MPNIFISDRRDDSAASARELYTHLKKAFSNDEVFFDISNIAAGDKLPPELAGFAHISAHEISHTRVDFDVGRSFAAWRRPRHSRRPRCRTSAANGERHAPAPGT